MENNKNNTLEGAELSNSESLKYFYNKRKLAQENYLKAIEDNISSDKLLIKYKALNRINKLCSALEECLLMSPNTKIFIQSNRIDTIIAHLNQTPKHGDISDIGNSIGMALNINDEEKQDLMAGLEHGLSIANGTHK